MIHPKIIANLHRAVLRLGGSSSEEESEDEELKKKDKMPTPKRTNAEVKYPQDEQTLSDDEAGWNYFN